MNWEETRSLEALQKFDLPEEWKMRIDLRGAHLRGAHLRGADLRGAAFHGADLRGAKGIISSVFDQRGYMLVCWLLDKEVWFNAGCRSFSESDALAHWGSKEYPDQKRGQQYTRFVKFLAEEIRGV